MFVSLSFWGLIMMAVTSHAQDHPGNPANGTCTNCNGAMYDNGVWHNVCTEDFTCPLDIADIENTIEGKEVMFHAAYYYGNAAFVPGTRHYAYVEILADRIDSIKKGDIGTVAVPTDNCQRCEVDEIEDAWVQFVCTIVDCPSAIATEIELLATHSEKISTRDRFCLVRKNDEYTIYTCEYYTDDPNFVDDLIQAST
ncbi:uncharacterized protein LOC102801149 [Saccoglossus kowalevskii]|uniref:Uncharacterized protein LOC102801149 n=1 Tax=Saccoglossus kowalevskii TaxID=10224 RepID=A0ABM0MWK2_SACKO|nr:PREDICTED: uncharacterized protein LOC102801149 [Saccoglossus kowalevskii]